MKVSPPFCTKIFVQGHFYPKILNLLYIYINKFFRAKTPGPEILKADFIKIFWWDLKKLVKDHQNKHLILNRQLIIKY